MKKAAWIILLAILWGFQGRTVQAAPWDSVQLGWVAVGDDSLVGQATSYDIRYSTAAITAANFNAATRWLGPPVKVPAPPFSLETVVITGLQAATQYWFAVKTGDEVPNWSAISNVITVTTAAAPDTTRPAPVNIHSP